MSIQSQIPRLIVGNIDKLIQQVIPSISQMAENAGIKDILGNPQFPSSCLPKEELDKLLTLRNSLLDKINTVAKTVELLSKPIDPLTTTVDTISNAIDTTKTAITTANIALAAFPGGIAGPPGIIPATINNLNKLIDFLDPQVTIAKNQITSISKALNYANNIFPKLVNILKVIDQYLAGCGVTSGLTQPSSSLSSVIDEFNKVQNVNQEATQGIGQGTDQGGTGQQNQEIYNGFILEIVTEPFSPTVNRVKAVAKNKSGVILLQTPLSFTDTPQVLINKIKLLIDSNNLKAD